MIVMWTTGCVVLYILIGMLLCRVAMIFSVDSEDPYPIVLGLVWPIMLPITGIILVFIQVYKLIDKWLISVERSLRK